MNDNRVTIEEAARITGRSVNTIRRWIKSSKIKAELDKGIYKIDASELGSHAQGSQPEAADAVDTRANSQSDQLDYRKAYHELADRFTRLAETVGHTETALTRYQDWERQLHERIEALVGQSASLENELKNHREREKRFRKRFPLLAWIIDAI